MKKKELRRLGVGWSDWLGLWRHCKIRDWNATVHKVNCNEWVVSAGRKGNICHYIAVPKTCRCLPMPTTIHKARCCGRTFKGRTLETTLALAVCELRGSFARLWRGELRLSVGYDPK